MKIDIPAEVYVELLDEMNKAKDGWEATDIMHRTLQVFMKPGSIDEYIQAYYSQERFKK